MKQPAVHLCLGQFRWAENRQISGGAYLTILKYLTNI